MKAKVKETGEIIYDVDEKQFDYGRYEVHGRDVNGESVFYDSNKVIILPREFQEEKSIDWEERRWDLCCDIIKQEYKNQHFKEEASIDWFVNDVVRTVDNLIAELKKEVRS